MFTHLIYYHSGVDAIYGWDPATDLLVEPSGRLVWRHVRQRPAYDSLPYGGVILDRQDLSVIRFKHDLYFEGVEEWMEAARRANGNRKLGFHRDSHFRSILRPLYYKRQEEELNERIDLINEFFDSYHPVPGGHVPWRRGVLGGGHILEEWIALKHCFIDSCLGVVSSMAA